MVAPAESSRGPENQCFELMLGDTLMRAIYDITES